MVCTSALLISLAGLVSSFIAYYPGAMTWDSFVMWGMGWTWPWHDWHTPYIAVLMGVSRRLQGDPSLLLLLQLLLSWSGLYFCACGLRRHARIWAALLPLLGFTPMFLVLSGYLHKTPLQASVFTFVFGVLYHHHQWKRRLTVPWMLLLMLLLLFGIPLREYGLLCALPLSALLFYCQYPRLGTRPLAAYLAAAIVLGGASLAIHHIVVYHVLHAQKLHKIQTLYRYDLAAIYALTGADFAPRMIREEYSSHAAMKDLYEREDGMWRITRAYEGGIPRGYAVPKDISERLLTEEEVAYYRSAWLEALRQHPGAWLKHRAHGFATSLGVGVSMYGFRRAVSYRSSQNVFGLYWRGSFLYRPLNRYMTRVDGSLILKPWFWLGVTACLLLLGSWGYVRGPLYRDRLTPLLALGLSGALLYPQLFLTGLDKDVRFSYWAILSGALSLYLSLAALFGRAPQSGARGSRGPSGNAWIDGSFAAGEQDAARSQAGGARRLGVDPRAPLET